MTENSFGEWRTCGWCGVRFKDSFMGPHSKWCKNACRMRAYRERKRNASKKEKV